MRRRTGFTLIELLIVVAIIAILAAIALPNFLEAQTRAKVARVHSDLRTIATALEQYQLDYNRYLQDGDDYAAFNPAFWSQFNQFNRLTTPVAYLPGVPVDIFHYKNPQNPAMSLLFPGKGPYPYCYITQGNFGTHK